MLQIYIFFQAKIPWSTDISDINGDAIKVEVQKLIRGSKSLNHNLMEKTFFKKNCDVCDGSLLMQVHIKESQLLRCR